MPRLLNCSSVCFVCRRRSAGFAVGSTPKELGWFCSDCGTKAAKVFFDMKTKEFDRYEEDAVKFAMPQIGDYLDKIGKTDLAEMDEAEAQGLVEAVVKAFGAAMREACATLEPPF